MKKSTAHKLPPEITEYTDEDGKKWIQTSTDDLFSLRELNDILDTINRQADSDEIILARIDFQKVDRKYYEAVALLQARLQKQTELLRRLLTESRTIIDRKNHKLKELIGYIRKLHLFLAHLPTGSEALEKMKIPPEILKQMAEAQEAPPAPRSEPVYSDVEEVILEPPEDL